MATNLVLVKLTSPVNQRTSISSSSLDDASNPYILKEITHSIALNLMNVIPNQVAITNQAKEWQNI